MCIKLRNICYCHTLCNKCCKMATKNTIDDFIIGDKLDNNNYDVAQKIQYLLNEQEGLKGPNLIP